MMKVKKVLLVKLLVKLCCGFLCSQPVYAYGVPFLDQPKSPFADEFRELLSENKFYYQLPPTPLNDLTTGEILAAPYQTLEQIIEARVVSGELPAGTAIYPNGLVTVVDQAQIQTGTYVFEVETMDKAKERVKTRIALTLKPATRQPDRDAVYKMARNQQASLFANGDVLATAMDVDGEIAKALHVMGILPPGSELHSNGKIVVKDQRRLESGAYTAGIVTVDEKGGTTFFLTTVSIKPELGAE